MAVYVRVTGVRAIATADGLSGRRSETVAIAGELATATAAALVGSAYTNTVTPPAFAATLTTYAPVVSVTHGSPVAFLAIYNDT